LLCVVRSVFPSASSWAPETDLIQRLVLLFLLLLPLTATAAVRLTVMVTDSLSGDPVADVRVRAQLEGIDGAPQITSRTDDRGQARLHLEAGSWVLRLRHGSFASNEYRVSLGEQDTTVTVALRPVLYRMPERLASAVAEPTAPGVTSLAPTEVTRYPAPTPDPLRILRILPGVASGGDQGVSAYSVRGGSWDENQVRIEGVEIDAPQLLRTGLAETLSPINGDLVEQMQFHVGVLPARFGDRLSSALDVGYRRPDSLEVLTLGSSTRQAATVSARTGNSRWIVGVRRADLSRLTSDLQTAGDFSPEYADAQGVLAWGDPHFGVDLFGLSGRSGFGLQPEDRALRYDCGTSPPQPPRGSCHQFAGTAFGFDQFEHDLDIIGARLTWRTGAWRLQMRSHHLRRAEREDTDATYLADWIPSSYTPQAIAPDWLETHTVVRGRLHQERTEWGLSLTPAQGESWEIGGGIRRTAIDGERVLADTLWLDGTAMTTIHQEQTIEHTPVNHFAYARRTWEPGAWAATTELRAARFEGLGDSGDPTSAESVWLPKLHLSRRLGDWRVALATGLAAQPPLYKELIAAQGHTVAVQKGADATFEIEQQTTRWRWRSAGFYRRGWDRISFTIDDVELRYAPRTDSRTRAWGAETHLRGQVGRAVGTVSYSLLWSRENLDTDDTGWVPMATDQRHTATAYLEDRMDLRLGWLQASRFHIRVLYGSGYPYTAKIPVIADDGTITGLQAGRRHAQRDDGYIRFDIGTTQAFRTGDLTWEVREEVANLFDEFNAVSYRQLPAPDGSMALLPRGLGRRVYNVEISARF
jgi:hypothetical protein